MRLYLIHLVQDVFGCSILVSCETLRQDLHRVNILLSVQKCERLEDRGYISHEEWWLQKIIEPKGYQRNIEKGIYAKTKKVLFT